MNLKNKLKQIPGSWYFLLVIILIYLLLFIFQQNIFFLSLDFFSKILLKIIPIFLLVFVLMAITNYYITPEFIIKHFKEKGIKKWFFIVIFGILSSGPIYMWYPFLADLKDKGLNYGLIACFLYNRAIKIPLLPFIILYFGIKYVLIISILLIIMSIIQGIIINKLMEVEK